MEGVSRYNGNADLHPIRLKLKRLRYAVELCLALNEEPCEDFIAQFKAVQDRLGEWNDQHAAVDRLCRIARRRSVMMNRPEWAMHLLSNAAGRLRKAQELAEAFRAEWPTFTKALSKYVSENKTRV